MYKSHHERHEGYYHLQYSNNPVQGFIVKSHFEKMDLEKIC